MTRAPLDLIDVDSLHSEEELEIRRVVRKLVDDRVRPYVAEWYESGTLPARDLAKDFGALGLLGMYLTGYGCP
ncbi:MAG TPA: acyl-CoA dehydrogenase family protein, partial [Micromonosporaceae bacterium]|nr:acyl-CoA dehydrogenase family protein [Micromonosporaceae bacterium]